ncbi:MAG: cellulase family glycosylhydrolase, partial [Chloroflexales bacterium]|nr:cellulase family glycosylhydrolase [Chloroflexales bacterium]
MTRRLSLALALLLALLALAPARPARAQSPVASPHPNGKQIVWPDGRARFVLGYNYEGPADRAWRMWERFDAALIDADLARARAGGANTVRAFVQRPLPDEILAGNYAKLDAVIASAARHGLAVLLTLHDYEERDLAQVAAVNARIAARYRGNPTLLAYDLRNEPQFDLVALSIYGDPLPPLQTDQLIAQYGERITRADIPAYRQTSEGRSLVPPRLTDPQAYIYVNVYRL